MEFRNARHTDNLKLIIEFYTNIIGLKVLFSFENQNNYNGVFIGKEGHNWHLEFTASNIKAEHKFDIEDVLVFYPTERDEYDKIVEQIEINNIEILIVPEILYFPEELNISEILNNREFLNVSGMLYVPEISHVPEIVNPEI